MSDIAKRLRETHSENYGLLHEEAAAKIDALTEVCRSAYQVAARGGKDTNWPALTTRLGEALN